MKITSGNLLTKTWKEILEIKKTKMSILSLFYVMIMFQYIVFTLDLAD